MGAALDALGNDGYEALAAWLAGEDQGPTLDERLGRCRPAWFAKAACSGMPAELFFPAPGDPATTARAVCGGCPVSAPCGQLAADNSEGHGIWAGLGPRERTALRKAG